MYPGDPKGRAENVINCHCVLVPVVGKGKASGIDVDVDMQTPCLLDVAAEKMVKTTVQRIHPTREGFSDWEFDWTKPERMGYSVYALRVVDNNDVQGLVSIRPQQGYVEVGQAEAAPWNNRHHPRFSGKKRYDGVGAHLFAEAARQSMEVGNGGYVAFVAKTDLIAYYQKALGAQQVGSSQRMYIDENAAERLISRYYGGSHE